MAEMFYVAIIQGFRFRTKVVFRGFDFYTLKLNFHQLKEAFRFKPIDKQPCFSNKMNIQTRTHLRHSTRLRGLP